MLELVLPLVVVKVRVAVPPEEQMARNSPREAWRWLYLAWFILGWLETERMALWAWFRRLSSQARETSVKSRCGSRDLKAETLGWTTHETHPSPARATDPVKPYFVIFSCGFSCYFANQYL